MVLKIDGEFNKYIVIEACVLQHARAIKIDLTLLTFVRLLKYSPETKGPSSGRSSGTVRSQAPQLANASARTRRHLMRICFAHWHGNLALANTQRQ
jgi:hypothetical protein